MLAPELSGLRIHLWHAGSAGSPFHVLYDQAKRPHELPAAMQRTGGYVLNEDGQPAPLVHMWDRFPVRYWTNFSVYRRVEQHAKSVLAQLRLAQRAAAMGSHEHRGARSWARTLKLNLGLA